MFVKYLKQVIALFIKTQQLNNFIFCLQNSFFRFIIFV